MRSGNTGKLAPAQGRQHVGTIDDPILFLVSEALGDQPLPTARLGLAHLPAETGVAGGFRMIRDELAVEPGGTVGAHLPVEREMGQLLDDDRRCASHAPLVFHHPVEMVGLDDPGPVGLTGNATGGAADGFEPPHMGLGVILCGAGIVLEVQVDGVAPVVGSGDLSDGSIHAPRLDVLRRHTHDIAVRRRLGRLAPADVDVMGPPIYPVDDQIMAIFEFVG